MKLLLQKSFLRYGPNWINGDNWDYEVGVEVTPVPYGLNSTEEQILCDQLKGANKKINWRINFKLKLEAVKTLDKMSDDHKLAIELTPYISSERWNRKDVISVLEMFRTDYPGSTFALKFDYVTSLNDLPDVLNAREMKVEQNGTQLSCQQETVISTEVADSLKFLLVGQDGGFERFWGMSVNVALPPSPNDVTNTFSALKRILHEEISSDFIIKARNGAGVKCLKGILMAQSDVLQAMFESGMQESKTGVVEMSDLSEECVRAFLKYLYYYDLADAREDINIAVELLYAADKYNVSSLEGALVKMLTYKDDSAFAVELALKIFLFIKDKTFPEAVALKQKQFQILKKNFGRLERSEAYKEFLKRDFVAVNDLIKHLFELAPDRTWPDDRREGDLNLAQTTSSRMYHSFC